jgi:hypothetical protein
MHSPKQPVKLTGIVFCAPAHPLYITDYGTCNQTIRVRDVSVISDHVGTTTVDEDNRHCASGRHNRNRLAELSPQGPGAAQRVGIDSFSFCHGKIQQRAAAVSEIAPLSRNAALDYRGRPRGPGSCKTLGLDRQTYERLTANRRT